MKNNNGVSARMLAEAGIMIALAKVLSMITLFQMSNGGSVTLASMAPLFFFAIRWGRGWGITVGAVYGLIDLLLGGYVVHPMQLILDYPLAYAMLGFAGLRLINSNNELIAHLPGILIGTILRLACHVLSGCIFYSTIDFTKAGASLMDAFSWSNLSGGFVYSFTYNASFLSVDFAICLIALFVFWKPLMKALSANR